MSRIDDLQAMPIYGNAHDDRTLLQIEGLQILDGFQTIQVNVENFEPQQVLVNKGERWTGDIVGIWLTETTNQSLGKDGLACA